MTLYAVRIGKRYAGDGEEVMSHANDFRQSVRRNRRLLTLASNGPEWSANGRWK